VAVIELGQYSLSVDGLSIPIQAGKMLVLSGLGISLSLGVLAGLVPAWRATRQEIAQCFRAV
jgi:ABC-type lipoprotein release transport system permease subunit